MSFATKLLQSLAVVACMSPVAMADQWSLDADVPTETKSLAVLHVVNQSTIDQANIALKRSKSNDVRAFAQGLVKDHTQVEQETADLAKKMNIDLAASVPSDAALVKLQVANKAHQVKLMAIPAAEFDREFLNIQQADHEAIINTLTQDRQQLPGNSEVAPLLDRILPTLKTHQIAGKKLLDQLEH